MNSFELLQIAKETIAEADAAISISSNENQDMVSNAGKDIKLKADKISETVIVDKLSSFTDIPILGEESGMMGEPSVNDLLWIVDPLDGTLNYKRGIPFTCISIALWRGESPVLGVVYDLCRKDLYSGIVGEGAWLNDQPLQVAPTTEKGQAVIATGFPSFRDYEDESLLKFVRLVQGFKKVRLFGAAALSLAFCASGVVDAYAEEDIMFWDVAAGIALVQASGGAVRYEPSPRVKWGMNVFCASNQSLMAE